MTLKGLQVPNSTMCIYTKKQTNKKTPVVAQISGTSVEKENQTKTKQNSTLRFGLNPRPRKKKKKKKKRILENRCHSFICVVTLAERRALKTPEPPSSVFLSDGSLFCFLDFLCLFFKKKETNALGSAQCVFCVLPRSPDRQVDKRFFF